MCDVKRLNFSCFFCACFIRIFYVLHPYNQKQMVFSTKKPLCLKWLDELVLSVSSGLYAAHIIGIINSIRDFYSTVLT